MREEARLGYPADHFELWMRISKPLVGLFFFPGRMCNFAFAVVSNTMVIKQVSSKIQMRISNPLALLLIDRIWDFDLAVVLNYHKIGLEKENPKPMEEKD